MSVDRIGRYTIEKPLARGGMAEVFLGRAEGPHGFAKSVVIKRILPELAEELGMVKMFLDEAKLAALLNHPNIVQVYDFGEEAGNYFIAMEYIQGESLRHIIRYHTNTNRQMPYRLAVQIASGVAEGLHYAHELSNDHGVSYNVVHRDVTPENILVSRTGIPKIVDFGIAKAASNSVSTQSGFLKGKYPYLAPEQVLGEAVGRQVDVYALGVTLFEMLTGGRPYVAENELALLKAILAGKAKRATEVRPDVPEALSDIISKSLSTVGHRYPDAASFQAALEGFLEQDGSRRLSKVEIAQTVAEVTEYRTGVVGGRTPTGNMAAITPSSNSGPKGIPGFPPGGVNLGRPPSASDAARSRPPPSPGEAQDAGAGKAAASRPPLRPNIAAEPSEALTDTRPSVPVPEARGQQEVELELTSPVRSRTPLFVGGGVLLLAAVAVIAFQAGGRGGGAPAPGPAPASAAAATGTAPATSSGTNPPRTPAANPTPGPVATAPASPATSAAASSPPAAGTGASQPGASASIATASRSGQTGSSAPTPQPGANPAATNPTPAVAHGIGTLTIRADPWCEVYVDGKHLGTTPLEHAALTAGPHRVLCKNDELKISRELPISIQPNAENKQAVLFPKGKLLVMVQPWAKVFVDGEELGTTPLPAAEVTEGTHAVRLTNDEVRKVRVQAHKTETLKVVW